MSVAFREHARLRENSKNCCIDKFYIQHEIGLEAKSIGLIIKNLIWSLQAMFLSPHLS